MLDAAVIVAAMGGAITVVTRREEDPDVPGEFFTTHAVVRWVSKGSYTERHPTDETPETEHDHAGELADLAEEIIQEELPEEPIVEPSDEKSRLPDPDSTEIPEDIPSGAEILAAAGE